MKKTILVNLDNDGKIFKSFNFWADEFPFELPNINSEITKKIDFIKNIIKIASKKICIEFSLPKHLSNYALLGIKYENDNSNSLEIAISDFAENEKYDTDITCLNKDHKYKGLLPEYRDTIYSTINNVLIDLGMGLTGKIHINVSAYCELGSSIKSFENAVKILMDLLFVDNYDEETLIKILKKYI